MEKEKKNEFHLPEYYENRELSWLKFDARVLNEAKDKSIPLLERLKFVSITSSNLDEFFMVRVASLKDMVHADYRKRDIAGMTASEQLDRINTATRKLVESQYNTYNRSLVPLMAANGIHIIEKYEELTAEQAAYVDRYFEEDVYPVLTPMAVDASRPFPLIRNKTLNIAALLSSKKDEKHKDAVEFATVQVPGVLPRLVPIPADTSENFGEVEGRTFILLEQIIEKNIDKLFLNYHVLCAQLLRFLKDELKVAEEDIFQISGPIDLTFLMKMYGLSGCDSLRYEPYKPQRVPEIEPGEDIFEAIRVGDILLHHPYETFDPVVDFIRQAASDPDVLAIKQTLYRVSGNSPIIASLAQAAENGKQVSVLVELKARFDEENNIVWAKKLEQAGCHVIYGLVGLKTHSKIALVVRREEDGIRRYVHLGTGNYNDSTAKLYTDCGIFTCNEAIGEDATAVFNMLSGYSEPLSWNELVLAPIWLRTRFMRLIARETKHAREGKPAKIVAKMNSLCDEGIIAALYEASAAGVEIELIVRGICCLKVGIPGISENIHVRSIVGNFLEHSRIFFFLNDGEEELYMGSADWMPRNLDRRVEILFPVLDDTLKEKVKHILDVELADNTKAHVLKPDGEYEKIDRRGKVLVNSQKQFCEEAVAAVPKTDHVYRERVFVPAEPAE